MRGGFYFDVPPTRFMGSHKLFLKTIFLNSFILYLDMARFMMYFRYKAEMIIKKNIYADTTSFSDYLATPSYLLFPLQGKIRK